MFLTTEAIRLRIEENRAYETSRQRPVFPSKLISLYHVRHGETLTIGRDDRLYTTVEPGTLIPWPRETGYEVG